MFWARVLGREERDEKRSRKRSSFFLALSRSLPFTIRRLFDFLASLAFWIAPRQPDALIEPSSRPTARRGPGRLLSR